LDTNIAAPIRARYQAPLAKRLSAEMSQFANRFNKVAPLDPVLNAAIAHLWFVTIQPVDDGNGRIARIPLTIFHLIDAR